MKPAVKRKWCKALKSGKFRQTQETLEEKAEHQGHKKYCCLGVLRCLMPDNLKTKSLANEGDMLSNSQLRWAGLTMDQQESLTELNDEYEYGFAKIARIIQKDF